MKFFIDSREPDKLSRIFSKLNECEITTLDVGDVVCPEKNLGIERKTIQDFVGSVKDGRIYKQIIQLCENYENAFLIIVGHYIDLRFVNKIQWTIDNHLGSLASIAIRSKIRILQVDNETQFCKLCIKLATKIGDGKVMDIRSTDLLKTHISTEDLKLKVLTCFDGIGLVRAQKLLDENAKVKETVSKLIELMVK